MRDASWQRSPSNSSSGKGGTRYHRPRVDDAALAHCDPMIMLNDDQPCSTDDELLFGMLCRRCFPTEEVTTVGASAMLKRRRDAHHDRCAQPLDDQHLRARRGVRILPRCQLLPVAT